MKHADQIDWIVAKTICPRHGQATAAEFETMHLFLALKERWQARARARFFLLFFQRGAKNRSQVTDIFGNQKILPHEFLDRFHARRTCGVEASRQTFLHIEAQALFGATGQKVQMTAHLPQKRIAFEGHGILTDIIVLVMEIIVFILKEILKLLLSIWKLVLFFVSWPFESIYSKGWDGFSKQYRDGDVCKSNSFMVKPITLLRFITVLFPPLGVFLDRGVTGFGHIAVTSLLTAIFYFPGMIYGMMLINDILCPTSIEIFTMPNFKGERYIFSYGDYSVKSNETLKKITCIKDPDELTLKDKTTNNIRIGSFRLGKSVNLKLFKNPDFTNLVYNGETSVSDLANSVFNKESNTISDCGTLEGRDPEITVATVSSFSIILKDPPKLTPETVQDQEVVFYLLNDFRGQMISLDSGTYTSKDLSEVFSGRISSIRIGKNVKLGLFENDYFNRKVKTDTDINSFSFKYNWQSSNGKYLEVTYENVKYENIDYDIVNGEIPNLSLYDFNDKINSIIICDNKSCNIDRIAKANE